MPELPEVETIRRGIEPHIKGQKIEDTIIRNFNLRWPIANSLTTILKTQIVDAIKRRGKYLLLVFDSGTLILHLGMSGSLRILTHLTQPQKHDHVDFTFENKKILRFTDPRRFGALVWTDEPNNHPLLQNLGVEPLDKEFSKKYLWLKAQRSTTAIKSFVMNQKIVVGIGNIYATEALFLAGIHPCAQAKNLAIDKLDTLVNSIKFILKQAIKRGGTTLRDFVNSDGKPGYFAMQLKAYGRAGSPCMICHSTLKLMRMNNRGTVYCPQCQPNLS